MNKNRVIGNVLAVLSFGLAGLASAQSFPDRPITLVVPNPPGGLVERAIDKSDWSNRSSR